jgi:Tfp pilus assembly protein PilV
MRRQDRALGGDRGDTLIELVVAVTIMSVAVVAIVGGIGTSILMSGIHRQQATAGTVLRNYAEQIEKRVAATPTAYTASCSPTYASDFVPPTGFTATITRARFWNGSTFPATPCNSATDVGVQQVSLRVQNTDGRVALTLDLVLRNPCRAADPSCS